MLPTIVAPIAARFPAVMPPVRSSDGPPNGACDLDHLLKAIRLFEHFERLDRRDHRRLFPGPDDGRLMTRRRRMAGAQEQGDGRNRRDERSRPNTNRLLHDSTLLMRTLRTPHNFGATSPFGPMALFELVLDFVAGVLAAVISFPVRPPGLERQNDHV
jgi:hypothetical protein